MRPVGYTKAALDELTLLRARVAELEAQVAALSAEPRDWEVWPAARAMYEALPGKR